MLRILLMLTELDMNKYDEKAWKDWLEQEDRKMIKETFSKIIFSKEEAKGGFRIDKTRKRREYDAR